jgi:hypothetical protein
MEITDRKKYYDAYGTPIPRRDAGAMTIWVAGYVNERLENI